VRRAWLVGLLVFVCVSAAGIYYGPAPVTGDETEYYAMTYAWATHGSPALTPQVVRAVRSAIPDRPPAEPLSARALDGSDYAIHFWFLSLLTTPFFILCRATGLDWRHCFVFIDALAFAALAALAYRRLRWAGALVLIAGLLDSPVERYLYKAHSEAWSVSLLGIAAICLVDRRWLAAALALSAVAAQVSAFSPLAVLVLARWAFDEWRTMRSTGQPPAPAALAGAGACVALLAVQPLWTLAKYRTLNLIVAQGYVFPQMATPRRIASLLLDPDVGFFFGWPLGALLAVAIVAGWMAAPELLRRYRTYWAMAAVMIAEFSYVGAQQANYTSSAPRYWLWLIPLLLVGFVVVTRARRRWSIAAGVGFVLAAVATGTYLYPLTGFRPGLKRLPLAELWYRHFPGLWNPPEQVFIDFAMVKQVLNGRDLFFRRRIALDELPYPHLWAISNESCTKLLVLGYAFTSSHVEPLLPLGCNAPVDGRQLLRYVRSTGRWRSEDQYVSIPASVREEMGVIPSGSVRTPVENRPPRVDGYDVGEAGGAAPIYTFRFSDPDGWQDLGTATIMISSPAAVGQPEQSCYITYSQVRNELAVAGRWCSVDARHTWAGEAGDSLAVRMPIALDPAIAASAFVVQGAVTDQAGHSTGWVRMERSWRSEPPVLPDRGGSPELTFEPEADTGGTIRIGFSYQDPHAHDVTRVRVLINDRLSEQNACLFEYEPVNGLVRLLDAGAPTLWLAEGSSVDNGRCLLDGRGSRAEGDRNAIELRLKIVRQDAFSGTKRVWMKYQEDDGTTSAWQETALWRGASDADASPSVFFLEPDARGDVLHLRFDYSGSELEDVAKVWVLINDVLDERSSCYLTYVPAEESVYLNGAGRMLLAERRSMENPQCQLDARDILIKRNGPRLDLRLRIARKGSFQNPRRVWAADEKKAAGGGKPKVSPWMEVGTWR